MSQSPAGLFRGLFETHLHVADLEEAMNFYGEVLGFELGLHQQERRAAFYWIGRDRNAMLGLWEKPPWGADESGDGAGGNKVLPQHLAFTVDFAELTAAIDHLKQRGIELRDFFDRVTDEPSVFGWIPAASIYFNDVDGHLLECIARLEGEPAPELGVISLAEWRKLKEDSRPSPA
jgi:catechol 2,3-dioxygenase-like lactoylglutathione lyase family enzyme